MSAPAECADKVGTGAAQLKGCVKVTVTWSAAVGAVGENAIDCANNPWLLKEMTQTKTALPQIRKHMSVSGVVA